MRAALFSLAMLAPLPVLAQQFTTAAEVRPILTATKTSWIGVREWDGQDLIYFTHLEAWRCGLLAVRFGVNGNPPSQPYPLAPCQEGTAQPNAIPDGHLPYAVAPLGSIQSVTVEISYDDGGVDQATFERASVLLP